MMKLSLCMIVKDDMRIIDTLACARALGIDEICVVLDEGYDPRIEQALSEIESKVLIRPLDDDFAAQRNASFEMATGDWILWLDSDDTISMAKQHMEFWKKMMRDEPVFMGDRPRLSDNDVVMLPYWYAHEDDKPTILLWRERLMRREIGWTWKYPIHEVCQTTSPDTRTRLVMLDIPVIHHRDHAVGERNLRITERYMNDYISEGRFQFYAGNEYSSQKNIPKAIECYERVLEHDEWHEHRSIAAHRLGALWAMQKEPNKAREYCAMSMLIDPMRLEPFILLGDIARQCGVNDEALHWYTIAANMKLVTRLLPQDPRLPGIARMNADKLIPKRNPVKGEAEMLFDGSPAAREHEVEVKMT